MSERPQVWITRAEPGASATAARISALGFAPLVAPLLTIHALDTPIDLEGVAALAFTSGNGVQAFAVRSPRRDLPVFAVGDATAKAARLSGFAEVASAHGDVAALARLVMSASPEGVVLHPGPVKRAGDFAGALKRQGFTVRSVNLYETAGVDFLPEAAAVALAGGGISAVLIHSPRASAVMAPLVAQVDLSDVVVIGLSKACLRPLQSVVAGQVAAAKTPREGAMIDALLAALGNPSDPR